MKTRGALKGIDVPFRSNKAVVSLEVTAAPEDLEKLEGLDLDIELKKHRQRRSLDANAMLWACIGEIAAAVRWDNWSTYLYLLERYGKFTHILVRPDAVQAVEAQWRETKIVGETDVNDPETGGLTRMVQMLCFFGSSTYDTAEFSRLLDGTISEMRDIGLTPPPTEQMKAALERRENDQAARQGKARAGGAKQGGQR